MFSFLSLIKPKVDDQTINSSSSDCVELEHVLTRHVTTPEIQDVWNVTKAKSFDYTQRAHHLFHKAEGKLLVCPSSFLKDEIELGSIDTADECLIFERIKRYSATGRNDLVYLGDGFERISITEEDVKFLAAIHVQHYTDIFYGKKEGVPHTPKKSVKPFRHEAKSSSSSISKHPALPSFSSLVDFKNLFPQDARSASCLTLLIPSYLNDRKIGPLKICTSKVLELNNINIDLDSQGEQLIFERDFRTGSPSIAYEDAKVFITEEEVSRISTLLRTHCSAISKRK